MIINKLRFSFSHILKRKGCLRFKSVPVMFTLVGFRAASLQNPLWTRSALNKKCNQLCLVVVRLRRMGLEWRERGLREGGGRWADEVHSQDETEEEPGPIKVLIVRDKKRRRSSRTWSQSRESIRRDLPWSASSTAWYGWDTRRLSRRPTTSQRSSNCCRSR